MEPFPSENNGRELNQIQKFQHQQKLIEEKNKQTKTLLAQAIKERRARAESEAHLLTDLQKELSRLDTLLTTDVSIIRDRIETASLEYSESQKRYEKAEKEFVNAKMELFRRAETKEKLTEHLYTIIYQNEMRKAQKLSELMEMLELTTACEEVECILPAIPPPMYNPMQTLGSCGKFPHTTKPGSADPMVKPSNADPAIKPDSADPAIKPDSADPAIKPDSADPAIKPDSADPTVKPDSADPTVKPGNADQAIKPGNADPTVKPDNADQAIKPDSADPTVKPDQAIKPDTADSTVKISIEQKVEGQSVAPNVPIERKESLSECTPSSPPMSQIHNEGQLKQNEPNMIADVCIASSSLQNSSATPMTAEVESAVDPSVESAELPESESSKEDEEHGASLSGRCNISDSDSLTETEKISSQSHINDDTKRTNKEKKTTLKELAK